MRISESPTRDCSLGELPIGVRAWVVAIAGDGSRQLAAHGLHLGVLIAVEDDAPFGGPRIVRLGAARLAVARRVAETIQVRPESRLKDGAR